MFLNLNAEQTRNKKTNREMAEILRMSRNTYEAKKKTGKFTYREIKTLCEYFQKDFGYLFATEPDADERPEKAS